MTVVRLIYFSEYRIDLAMGTMIAQLNDILTKANRFNREKSVTGALVFDSEWFVQVLEGNRDAVLSIFKKIERDKRHDHVTLVEMVEAPERAFGKWWMGCTERNERTASTFAPFLHDGRFRPEDMSAHDILSLMIGLEKVSLTRELAA